MLSGFDDGSLSREHSFLALEMIDQYWADLDAESFLTSCSKGMRNGSLDAQSKAIHAIFRRDRKRGLESWSVSAIRREPARGPLLLLELVSSDPESMIEFCRQQPEWDDPASFLAPSLYLAWAGKNGDRAWRELQCEPGAKHRARVAASLILRALPSQPDLAARWLAKTNRPEDLSEILHVLSLEPSLKPAQVLDVVKRADSEEVWRAWAVHPPRAIQGAEWVGLLCQNAPEKLRLGLLVDVFAAGRHSIPARGEKSNPVFDAIPDPVLQETLRGLSGRGVAASPARPKAPPAPDADAIDAAYWDGPASFTWLVLAHDASESDWRKQVYKRHPQRAMEEIKACLDPYDRRLRAMVLASVLPKDQLGERTRELLASGKKADADIALEFAEQWLSPSPEEALRALAALPDRQAAPVFLRGGWIHKVGHKLSREQIHGILAGIQNEDLRQHARATADSFALAKLPFHLAVPAVVAMPRGELRDRALSDMSHRLREADAAAITGVLDELLARDEPGQSRIKDTLLGMLAISLFDRGNENFDSAMKVFDGIRSPEERVKVFETFLGRGGEKSEEFLLAKLATLPVGTQRTILIGKFADALAVGDRTKALSIAKRSESLELRSSLLTNLIPRVTEPDLLAEALRLAADLPGEWKSATLSRHTREALARHDPAKWWKENVRHGFSDPLLAESARIALKTWITTDPDSALRAWLASGPDPALSGIQSEMADRFLLPSLLAGKVPKEMFVRPSDALIEACVSCWVTRDPAAATRFCLAIESAGLRKKMLGLAFGQWIKRDEAAALAWAASVPVGLASRDLLANFISKADWSAPLSAEQMKWLRDAAAREPGGLQAPYHGSNARAALNALEEANREFSEGRSSVRAIARIDPEAASDLARSTDGEPIHPAALLGLLDQALAAGDEEQIKSLAKQINTPGGEMERVETAAALLRSANGENALRSRMALIENPAARLAGASVVMKEKLAVGNPDAALAIALALPNLQEREQASSLVVRDGLAKGTLELQPTAISERAARLAKIIAGVEAALENNKENRKEENR